MATPTISSVSGNTTHQSLITVAGTNFGTHANLSQGYTWGGRSFLSRRFKDMDSGVKDADGFIHLNPDASLITFPNDAQKRPNSTYYMKIRSQGSENTNYRAAVDASPARPCIHYVSFWFHLHDDSGNGGMQSGKFYRHYVHSSDEYNYYLATGCVNYEVRGGDNPISGEEWGTGSSFGLDKWWRCELIESWNANNVSVAVYQNGVQAASSVFNNMLSGGSWSASYQRYHFPNMIDAVGAGRCDVHPTWDGSYNYDDIFIDQTRARVEVSNSSTWANRFANFTGANWTTSGVKWTEIQLPVSWSDTGLTFSLNRGAFAEGETLYAYVVNSGGEVNATGVAVSEGSTPPTGTITLSVR